MTSRNLGLAREFKLAHAALATPFAQVFAGGFTVWLHSGRLVTGRSAIHYLRGNRLRRTTITWLGQSQIMEAVMRIWKMTHAALSFLTFRVIASRAAASDLTAVINQRRPL